MPKVTQEEAVKEFEKLTTSLIKGAADVKTLLSEFINFYRGTRIAGASFDDDGDMLLLEWGATHPHLLDQFTDMRTGNPDRLKFDPKKYRWLGLTRQIFVTAETEEVEEEEPEFDDSAITLCLYLFFEPVAGDEDSSNLWIHAPQEVARGLAEFKRAALVAPLLEARPSRVNAFVSAIG